MKHKIIIATITLFCGINLYSLPAWSVTEAGEIQRKTEHTPHAELYVANNITDLNVVNTASSDEYSAEEPINFSADEMINDEKGNIVTAQGNVEIQYNGMRLQTDKLVYDQNKDLITAIDNVRLHASDGSIIFSDRVSLSDNMTAGEMQHIKVLLKDKSHVWAEDFHKKDNQTKTLTSAAYTACDICEGKDPMWLITARKVQHNEKTQDINYNDAVVRFKGVPFFYTPFLTHPDPTVKRRSGLMNPSFGSSNFLGLFLQPRYFIAANDQTNIMLSPIISEDKGIIWSGAYQQYFYTADTSMTGTYLNNSDDDRPKHRGNFFATGRYDINQNWRMKYDLKYVSDYIYLKEMNLPYDDDAWLTSNINFERFSGRDYASVEAYYYKMLSYNLHRRNADQFRRINHRKPYVAPLVDIEMYTDPSSIGSYFKNEISTASVYHQNGMQTQRLTSINSWELPLTTPFGEKYRFVTSLKSDAYYVNRYQYLPNDKYTGTTTRFFPQAGVEWRLPFVRATQDSRQILEPVIVGVVAPNGGNKIEKIPNEDSQDVYFDDTNVLDLDRYAGYDRNDTGSRLSYGLRWSTYGNIIGRTSSFIAQSLEKSKNSSFVENLDSRNKSHFSDLVGRVNAEPNQYLDLNYRFRLDRKTLDAKYSELGVDAGPSFLRGYVSYIFLQGNTYYNDLYSERKELYTSIRAQLSQYWSLSIFNLQDLTAHSRGSLERGGSVIYEDECFKWVTTVKKYNSSNPSLDNDYEFGATFYLKTIGSFGS